MAVAKAGRDAEPGGRATQDGDRDPNARILSLAHLGDIDVPTTAAVGVNGITKQLYGQDLELASVTCTRLRAA